MFENILINILLCGLLLFYPFFHNFFRYIGEKFIKNEKFFLNYIRFINILFLPSCIFIVGLFLFTDFSFNSGWQLIQESSASGTDWTNGKRHIRNRSYCLSNINYITAILMGSRLLIELKSQKVLNEDYD